MKKLRHSIAVLACFSALGIAGYASAAWGHGPCGPMMSKHSMEQRLDTLHAELKLNPAQEKAWKAYTDHFIQQRDAMYAQRQNMDRTRLDKLTAPERAEKMLEIHKQRGEFLEQNVANLKAFYNTLNAEQKKVVDRDFGPFFNQGPGPGGRRGMGYGRQPAASQ